MSLVHVGQEKNISSAMGKADFYVGLISGTSCDGVDAVITSDLKTPTHSFFLPYPDSLKIKLNQLINEKQFSLPLFADLDKEISLIFSQAAKTLLDQAGVSQKDVLAIGSHGQTIYHEGRSYSLQLGNGALISENTGIKVITDFRMTNIAAQGEGAPLTPIYHKFILGEKEGAVVNLGGIANITLIKNDQVIGYDSGPANTLLDNWMSYRKSKNHDQNGDFSRSGKVLKVLLEKMLSDPYFKKAPPKSSGREYFNLAWLQSMLDGSELDEDVAATIVELTALSIANEIPKDTNVYLCGGGCHNKFLVERIAENAKSSNVQTIDKLGYDVDNLEAMCFAFLAHKNINKEASDIKKFTGARHNRVLGAMYSPFENE